MAKGRSVDPNRAQAMEERISRGRAQMDTFKGRAQSRPLGGAPEVKIPPLVPGTQKQRQPAMVAPPPPPGVGVGAGFAAARQVSFGSDPMQGVSQPAAVAIGNPGGQPPGTSQAPPGAAGLSAKSIAGMEALAAAQQTDAPAPLPLEAGGPDPDEQMAQEPEPEDREELFFEPAMDIENEVRRLTNLLASAERRKTIEDRCPELKFDDWIQTFELRQRVPIIPGKLEPTFRTPNGHEDLFIRQYIGRDRGVDSFIMNKFAMLNLTLALVDVGSIKLPHHLDTKTNQVDEEKFEAKLNLILRFPLQWLADLSINYTWFEVRARRLLTAGNVKNG